jgi:hypothetical protein
MLLGDLLLDLEGGVEVEVVEELEGLADGGGEIEGVGVGRRLGVKWGEEGCEEEEQR